VFPIYDFKPPLIIRKFVRKLKNISSKYIFGVCTYGITPSKSMKNFDKVIKSCGGNLSAGFAVSMPHNGIGSSLFSQTQHASRCEDFRYDESELNEKVAED
jgi:hypothetical protein